MTIQDAIREHLPAYMKLIENEYYSNTITSCVLMIISILLVFLILCLINDKTELPELHNNICVAIIIISMICIIIFCMVSLCHKPWEYFIYQNQYEAMAIERICRNFGYIVREYNFSINPFHGLK